MEWVLKTSISLQNSDERMCVTTGLYGQALGLGKKKYEHSLQQVFVYINLCYSFHIARHTRLSSALRQDSEMITRYSNIFP